MAMCSLLGVWRPASFSLSLSRSFTWRWLILPGVRRTVSSPHTTAAAGGEKESGTGDEKEGHERRAAILLQITDRLHTALLWSLTVKRFTSADNLNMCPCLSSLHLIYMVPVKRVCMLFLGNRSSFGWQSIKTNACN